MAACVGGCGSSERDEAAAVPVRALLVAALHPPAADAAPDATAERIDASGATEAARRVVERTDVLRGVAVALRAFLDLLEQLATDERLMRGSRAPDPLVARPDEGTAAALVVTAPDVVAGVLGVAEHRVQLRAAPGLGQVVLVLLVARRRRVAVEVCVELLAELAEAEPAVAVVLEDHPDDRGLDRVGDKAVLLPTLASLLRVRMLVRFEGVTVGRWAAGMPALANAFLHAATALLDQVA